jgi:serine/threonine-protein kinase
MTSSRALEAGQIVLGRYRIVRRLAEGGMGAIYLARIEGAAGFVKPAVVKQIHPDRLGEPRFLEMFAREARILARLRHPSIVSVLDFAEEAGSYLMALDYVHGHHLGQWRRYVNLTQGPFPIGRIVHIGVEVLQALHYAHTARDIEGGESLAIIHRDVKPSNILVDVDGQVKLVDFGVARAETDRSQVDAAVPLKGTFTYMAPELFEDAPPGPQTDVYALGVVMHEVIVGKNEFRGPDTRVTIGRVLSHQLSVIDTTRKDVPPGLRDVIARATCRSPDGRYASAGEFAAALRALRIVDPHGAADEIRETAQRDFRDPRFGTLLHIDDLSGREKSLRGAGNEPLRLELVTAPTVAVIREPTVLDRPSPVTPPPRRRGRRWALAGATLGLVLAGLVYGAVWMRPDATRPQIVVVRGAVSPDDLSLDAAPAAVAAADAAAPTSAPSVPDAGMIVPTHPRVKRLPPPHAPPRPADPAALSRVFERRRSDIHACFSTHVVELQGVPQIAISFQVDPEGRLVSARVQPPAVAGTPLGNCLERVARTTDFGQQARGLTFRIPITMRSKR